MKKYEVKDHAPSILPDGYEFELVWSDEFDGSELDMTKWDYRLSMMGKRYPSWTDDAVRLEDSCVVFSIKEKDGKVVSPHLQTGYNFMDEPATDTSKGRPHLQWRIGKLKESKYTHKYGYFECRCRLQQMKGWWSAFWIQSPIIGATLDAKTSGAEIDVMESFVPGEVKPHNVFKGGYGIDVERIKVGGMDGISTDEFHTFGVLWTEDKYVFYVDGTEDGVIDKNVSDIPEFILISTEVNGYRTVEFAPTEEAFAAASAGDTFLVDYVRVFDIKKGEKI